MKLLDYAKGIVIKKEFVCALGKSGDAFVEFKPGDYGIIDREQNQFVFNSTIEMPKHNQNITISFELFRPLIERKPHLISFSF